MEELEAVLAEIREDAAEVLSDNHHVRFKWA
jgi:hypothetical protein